MKLQKISSEEGNVLLRKLLDQEQLERKDIATRLHGKKGDLLLIKFALQKIENNAKQGKYDPSKVAEINDIIDTYLEDSGSMAAEIFNPMLKLSGLLSGLKSLSNQRLKKYQTNITIITEWKEESRKTDVLMQLGVYRVCEDAVEYFALTGFKETKITLTINVDHLQVQLTGGSQGEFKATIKELKMQSDLIKANIFWRGAQVLPETNWNDTFKFEFPYQISTEKEFQR